MYCHDTCCQPWKEDWVDFLTLQRDLRVARKSHQCDRCGNQINKGEQYAYEFALVDGAAYSSCRHLNPNCDIDKVDSSESIDTGMKSA